MRGTSLGYKGDENRRNLGDFGISTRAYWGKWHSKALSWVTLDASCHPSICLAAFRDTLQFSPVLMLLPSEAHIFPILGLLSSFGGIPTWIDSEKRCILKRLGMPENIFILSYLIDGLTGDGILGWKKFCPKFEGIAPLLCHLSYSCWEVWIRSDFRAFVYDQFYLSGSL